MINHPKQEKDILELCNKVWEEAGRDYKWWELQCVDLTLTQNN